MYQGRRNLPTSNVSLASWILRLLICLCVSNANCATFEAEDSDGGISRERSGETIVRKDGILDGPLGHSNGTTTRWKVSSGRVQGVLGNRNITGGYPSEYRTPKNHERTVGAIVFTREDDNDDSILGGLPDPLLSRYKSTTPTQEINFENRSLGDSIFGSSRPLPYRYGSTTSRNSLLANSSHISVQNKAKKRENVTRDFNHKANAVVAVQNHARSVEGEHLHVEKQDPGGRREYSAALSKNGTLMNYPSADAGGKKCDDGCKQRANNKREGGDEVIFPLTEGVDIEEVDDDNGGYYEEDDDSLIAPYFIIDAPKRARRIECSEGEVFFLGRCRTSFH